MSATGAGDDDRPPGWYADPDRAETIRYWSGTRWTDRRRPRPAWSRSSAGILQVTSPAPASSARETTATRGVVQLPPPTEVPPGELGSGQPGGPAGPRPYGGGGGGDDDGEGQSERVGSRRRKWWLVAMVAALAAVAVAIAGEAMRPKSYGPRVLTDSRFVQLANAECAKTIPDLRPPESGPFGSTITPVQAADGIDHAAAGLDGLAGRLRALPAADADRPHINGWLDNWQRYTASGRQYAAFLRQHGTKDPGRLLDDSIKQARLADDFALANGLKSCTFSYTPQPDPASGF